MTLLFLLTVASSRAHRDLEIQVAELDGLIGEAPTAELQLRRADLLGRLLRPDEALMDLDAAATLGEDVSLQRALILSEAGRGEDARDLLDTVIATRPHWEAHRARARLRLGDGDTAGALADYDAAVARHVDPDIVLERGGVAREVDLDRAADGYLSALEEMGPAVVVELAAAEALRDAGRHDEARQILTAMMERSGPQPGWLLLRAEVSSPDSAHADRLAALELARARFEKKPNDLNQLAIEEATAALAAEPRGCTHAPWGGLLAAPLLLLGRRRC